MNLYLLAVASQTGGTSIATPIALGIASNLITHILIVWMGRFVRKWIASSTPIVGRIWIWSKPVSFTIFFLIAAICGLTTEGLIQVFWVTFTIFAAVSFFWFLYYPTIKMANAGIVGLDSHIFKGINYKKSLELCKNDLYFLGVGAAKLNEHPNELENAIRKSSSPANPVRFLLCDPSSPMLASFAARAGVNADEYSKKVEQSIKSLIALRDEKSLNIEIKLYNARAEHMMPKFRLMFINGDVCLMSYTIFGEGVEKNLPQYWIRQWQGRGDKSTLYYALNMYYEQLWTSSKPAK